MGTETVLNLGFKASPCGSTPHAVQHRAAVAFSSSKSVNSGTLLKEGLCDDSLDHVSSNDIATGALNANGRQVETSAFVRVLDSKCHSEHLRSSVPSRSWIGSSSCRGRRARWSGRGSSLCCSCCGLDLVGGNGNTCGECLLLAHGTIHGIRVWDTVKGKVQCMCMKWLRKQSQRVRVLGVGVWQPLEGSIPVGDELVKDPRRVSEKVHVEIRDGRSGATQYGTRLVELGKGCEVVVKIPCVPEKALMVVMFVSPRPGVPLRETWGWKPLLHTPSSGVWVLPGAL